MKLIAATIIIAISAMSVMTIMNEMSIAHAIHEQDQELQEIGSHIASMNGCLDALGIIVQTPEFKHRQEIALNRAIYKAHWNRGL